MKTLQIQVIKYSESMCSSYDGGVKRYKARWFMDTRSFCVVADDYQALLKEIRAAVATWKAHEGVAEIKDLELEC